MVQVLVEKLTEARRSYRLQPTNMSIEHYLLSCKLNPPVISLACTVKKKNVAFFGFSFLVTIVDPNLADGEGDGDVSVAVRGVIVPCAGWLMSRWPMVTGQCVIVEGSHLPFSTNFNNFAFKGLLQKSRLIIFWRLWSRAIQGIVGG